MNATLTSSKRTLGAVAHGDVADAEHWFLVPVCGPQRGIGCGAGWGETDARLVVDGCIPGLKSETWGTKVLEKYRLFQFLTFAIDPSYNGAMRRGWMAVLLLVANALSAHAQMNMGGPVETMRGNVLRHATSGTDLEPASSTPAMLMRMHGNWMGMLHGQAIVAEQQQTGPRGRDKLYSVNWTMPMAQRATAHGDWTFRTMLSLEPATITGRYYPELFQEGETAFGKAIVDGQHPHNLFMEIAGFYDRKVGERWLASF